MLYKTVIEYFREKKVLFPHDESETCFPCQNYPLKGRLHKGWVEVHNRESDEDEIVTIIHELLYLAFPSGRDNDNLLSGMRILGEQYQELLKYKSQEGEHCGRREENLFGISYIDYRISINPAIFELKLDELANDIFYNNTHLVNYIKEKVYGILSRRTQIKNGQLELQLI